MSRNAELFAHLVNRPEFSLCSRDMHRNNALFCAASKNNGAIVDILLRQPWEESYTNKEVQDAIAFQHVILKQLLQTYSSLYFRGLRIGRSPYLLWEKIARVLPASRRSRYLHPRNEPPNSDTAKTFLKFSAPYRISKDDEDQKKLVHLLEKLWKKVDSVSDDKVAPAKKCRLDEAPEKKEFDLTVFLIYLGFIHSLEMISPKTLRVRGHDEWIIIREDKE